MAGTGRNFFSETEKVCLQELVVRFGLNSVATTMGSQGLKKAAWARLTQEFNSIETNSKRTDAQLKKCWDNLKTRRKNVLAHEKRERMKTGGGCFNPYMPGTSTSSQDQVLIDDALVEQTDVELLGVYDSDNIPIAEGEIDCEILPDTPDVSYTSEQKRSQINDSTTERYHNTTTSPRLFESRLTEYGIAPSQGPRNIRTQVIQEEFAIRQRTYENSQKREADIHKFIKAEKEWIVKTAEQNFLKAKAEKEAAEELLKCNRAKREEAELRLAILKNKK